MAVTFFSKSLILLTALVFSSFLMSTSAFLKEWPVLGSILPLVRCFWLRK